MLSFFKINKQRLYILLSLSILLGTLVTVAALLLIKNVFLLIGVVCIISLIALSILFYFLNDFLKKTVQRNHMLMNLFNTMDEVVFIQDLNGKIEFSNRENETIIPKLITNECNESMGAEHTSQSFTDLDTGKTRYFDIARMPFKGLDNVTRILVVVKDLTAIHDLQQTAGKNKQRLEQVLTVSGEGLWEWNMKTGQVLHNDQWVKITNIGRSDNSFKEFEGCIFEEDRPKVFAALDNLIKNGIPYNIKFRMKRPDGTVIWVWDRGRIAEYDEEGKPHWLVGLILDVTQEQENEERISNLAYFDQLTGLTNRTQFEVELEKQVVDVENKNLYSALLLLDLDRFKLINDGYGHHMGDKLLFQVAKRLESIDLLPATNSRFGGDEFVILLPSIHKDKEETHRLADEYAKQVISVISEIFILESEIEHVNIEYNITVSVGGVTFFSNETDKDTLLKVADVALNRTKARGGQSVTILGDDEKNHLADKTELYQSLIDSDVNNEFVIHLQPKYNLDQQIIGAEALVRWNHPSKGFLTPWAFIEMAEENNVILSIGRTVIEQGCQVLKQWQSNPETKDLLLSLNVSAKQIWQSMFAEECIELVKSYDIDPTKLTLELTESVLIQDLDDAIIKLTKLRDFGLQISLDDFGTGFSSLSYLRQLPIDELKIDQSFVRNLTEDMSSQLLVKSIIDLAENFQLQIVAEGVETIEHFNMLRDLGVPLHQGYYFSKPISCEDFQLLLNDQLIQK